MLLQYCRHFWQQVKWIFALNLSAALTCCIQHVANVVGDLWHILSTTKAWVFSRVWLMWPSNVSGSHTPHHKTRSIADHAIASISINEMDSGWWWQLFAYQVFLPFHPINIYEFCFISTVTINAASIYHHCHAVDHHQPATEVSNTQWDGTEYYWPKGGDALWLGNQDRHGLFYL